MTSLEVQDLCVTLQGLWPSLKLTPQRIKILSWQFSRMLATDVVRAFEQHAYEFPDDTKPNYKLVKSKLVGTSTGLRNEWEQLLHTNRQASIEAAKATGRAELIAQANNESDEDVYAGYVKVNTLGITHDTITKQLKDDDDGKRAELARQWRETDARSHVRYLEEIGAEVPGWMVA